MPDRMMNDTIVDLHVVVDRNGIAEFDDSRFD